MPYFGNGTLSSDESQPHYNVSIGEFSFRPDALGVEAMLWELDDH